MKYFLTIISLGIVLIFTFNVSSVKNEPTNFYGKYEANIDGVIAIIHIFENGKVIYTNLPGTRLDKGVYSSNDGESSWQLNPPQMTPSGIWSLEFSGYFLSFHKNILGYKLCYPYDVTYYKDAWYKHQNK